MRVSILFNQPVLGPEHTDAAQERGVLDAVAAVETAAVAAGHRVDHLAVGGSGLRPRELLTRLSAASGPDVVVNLCEGFDGVSVREVYLTGLLELHGVAYTGCPPDALALVHHKARASWLLRGAGLPTAASLWIGPGCDLDVVAAEVLLEQGPVMVKPAAEDASLGIDASSVVTDAGSLRQRVELIRSRFGEVLVERYIDGREFNLGVVALPGPRMLEPAEIEFMTAPGEWAIVTYDAKWQVGSEADRKTPVRCPAEVSPALRAALEAIALRAFSVTGCRDYARVDVRVDRDGNPWVLEVNANPDIAPDAGLARALLASGITYHEFVERLIATAAERGPVRLRRRRRQSTKSPIIRPFQAGEKPALVEMTRACAVFRDDEVETADEVLSEAADDGENSHYQVLVAEVDGEVCGWSCHGRVPMTDASFDLYWIVVAPKLQARGIGAALLAAAESATRAAGGRWLLAETSSIPSYDATRRFYLAQGYHAVGEVADFYRKGDGKVTFGRRVDEDEERA